MTTTDVAASIHTLREQAIAVTEQRDRLATQARSALIAEWEAGRICRTGCADALTSWGLQPPPGELTMSGDGQMSYTRMHTDDNEARREAAHYVPEELHRLLPDVLVWPQRVVEVALIAGEEESADTNPYRITVQVSIRVEVTATSPAAAITHAQTMVANSRLTELTDADIILTGLTWSVYDGPDDLINTVDAHEATVRLPEVGDGLTAVSAARDAATEALADLRRKIRHRAISALVDDELGGGYDETAERVERFLLDLGLTGLPRAYHVTVTVDLKLRLRAATGPEAYREVRDTLQTITASPEASQRWTAWGYPTAKAAVPDGDRWLITWQHEYDIWLRGHTDPTDATTAAEAFTRTAITGALAGIDNELVTVTGTVRDFGIDPYLDPDTD